MLTSGVLTSGVLTSLLAPEAQEDGAERRRQRRAAASRLGWRAGGRAGVVVHEASHGEPWERSKGDEGPEPQASGGTEPAKSRASLKSMGAASFGWWARASTGVTHVEIPERPTGDVGSLMPMHSWWCTQWCKLAVS